MNPKFSFECSDSQRTQSLAEVKMSMLITRIRATNFLSFPSIEFTPEPGLTFVTGPNGVGKTNLGRCVDVALTLLHARNTSDFEQLNTYRSAGHKGATKFNVSLDIVFDEMTEKTLILNFIQAAFTYNSGSGFYGASSLAKLAKDNITIASIEPLFSGTLQLYCDTTMQSPWRAFWTFKSKEIWWHIPLVGDGEGSLFPDSNKDEHVAIRGSIDFARFILGITDRNPEAIPKAIITVAGELSLVSAMDSAVDKTISFKIPPITMLSESQVSESLNQVASTLKIQDIRGRETLFTQILNKILRDSIVLTDNRRIPFRRMYQLSELQTPVGLRNGQNIPARLFQLKNGTLSEREVYRDIEESFAFLTQRRLGLRIIGSKAEENEVIQIEPTIVVNGTEVPVEFSGAGIQEALTFSTLLSGAAGRFFVLDEPAVNLEPTMQRRLISLLRTAGQCLIITHSPDMVPFNGSGDLKSIIRLAPTVHGPKIYRLESLTQEQQARWIQLLEPTHIRALLFAAAVVLCEGSTETGALPKWWQDTSDLGFPDPEAANMPIISVNGDTHFGPYVDYLTAFGVPWVIIADGPALRNSSRLARHFNKLTLRSSTVSDETNFARQLAGWNSVGVFSLADQYGDDGSKGGEFEAFLMRVDPIIYQKACHAVSQSKPRRGAYFATHQSRPTEVSELYISIMEWMQKFRS